MVFFIQNIQNCDIDVLYIKIDELLCSIWCVYNVLFGFDDLDVDILCELCECYQWMGEWDGDMLQGVVSEEVCECVCEE